MIPVIRLCSRRRFQAKLQGVHHKDWDHMISQYVIDTCQRHGIELMDTNYLINLLNYTHA